MTVTAEPITDAIRTALRAAADAYDPTIGHVAARIVEAAAAHGADRFGAQLMVLQWLGAEETTYLGETLGDDFEPELGDDMRAVLRAVADGTPRCDAVTGRLGAKDYHDCLRPARPTAEWLPELCERHADVEAEAERAEGPQRRAWYA